MMSPFVCCALERLHLLKRVSSSHFLMQRRGVIHSGRPRSPAVVPLQSEGRQQPQFALGNSDARERVAEEPDDRTLALAKSKPSILSPFIDPAMTKNNRFNFHERITIQRLFDARVHFGHKVGTLKDNMKWALYGERLGVCIFDLSITQEYMVRALDFIAHLAYLDGRFLFITTNKSAMLLVEESAAKLGDFSNTRKWKPGTFINVRALVGGAPVRLPDALIFLNTNTSSGIDRHPAIVEAAKMCIPTVAVVDSNCEPNYISYPVPGNDDSSVSMHFYMDEFVRAINLGRMAREKDKKSEEGGGAASEQLQKIDFNFR